MKASLDDLHLFCRIIETGSLRAAAEEIGMVPSNVTRRLTGIEERLGVKLIARSRVRSMPTDAGTRYYRELKTLLDQLATLENDVAGAASEPRGLLRVSAPSVFGARYVGPWLQELQLHAPRLAIDLVLSDRPPDLVEQGIDIALRIGRLNGTSMTVHRLGSTQRAIVAAPQYLSRQGMPESPGALERCEFVQHAGQVQTQLRLASPKGRIVTVKCASRFAVSSILGVREAVIAGAGLNAGPLWLYADAIARGELVRVLPNWSLPMGDVDALVVPDGYRPAKINVALDMLRARVPGVPGIVAPRPSGG